MRFQWLPTLLAAFVLASAAQAADLTIEVTGVRSGAGEVLIAVYDSAATFSKPGSAVAALRLRARASAQSVTLSGLVEGSYAIAVFHDENQDGEQDENLVGIPTEGYGFSNGAVGRFGPPDFEAAKLLVGADPVRATIKLAY